MADSILRLRVESQEYDNKLKQAAQGLTRYIDECRKVGGTLEVVEKDTLDYVHALGQMDTTSRTATGKLAEMKKTFTELSVVYKNMTDEEKNSPFGKALATSLDQLKGRIGESKTQLDDINKSINGGGGLTGALDNLAGKFGMSVQSLASWGTALAAAKGALDVAKDAFFASEATVDEWGRVMDSSKSLYEGFLTALNTGDISGYLSRIDSIVQAARAAYNELDRLGTMKTIQAPQMSAQQTENERMRMMIQTGRYIAPVDGRRASMQNGQLLTPEQIKRMEQQLQNGMQKVVTLVGNEVAQTGRAIDAVYNRQAQELGMSLKEFRKGTSSMAEFDERMAGYDKYQKWRAEHTTIDMQSGRETVARGNPFEQFAKWGTFRVDGARYNDLVKLIQQRDQQAGQAYSMQSQAYRTMNRAEGVTLRQIMGGGSGGGKGGNTPAKSGKSSKQELTELQENQKKINDLVQEYIKLGDQSTESAQKRQEEIQKEIQMLKERNGLLGLRSEQAQGRMLLKASDVDMSQRFNGGSLLANPFASDTKAMKTDGLKLTLDNKAMKTDGLKLTLDNKAMKSVMQGIEKSLPKVLTKEQKIEGMQNLLGGVNGMLGGIQQIGIDIPEEIQSVMSVLNGIMTVVSSIESIVITGQFLGLFAHGGVVHAANGYVSGNNFSGDTVPILANSGELVLNRFQQQALAANIQNKGGGEMQVVGKIRGEEIVLVANRYFKRTGQGEILTW